MVSVCNRLQSFLASAEPDEMPDALIGSLFRIGCQRKLERSPALLAGRNVPFQSESQLHLCSRVIAM